MKVHKIRNVEKEVCCAEQKIAYNMAFRCHISHQERFNRLLKEGTQAGISEAIARMIREQVDSFVRNYQAKSWNVDAISHALRQGLETYLRKPFIATTYNQIGEAFPIAYELE